MKSAVLILTVLCAAASAFAPSTIRSVTYTRRAQQEKYTLASSPLLSDRKITQLANGRDEDNVNVNKVANVDAATLTALGFGAIAFNFLVLGNMGDMGIGGLVARIINTFM